LKLGIIGLGVVGSAIKYGFEKLGHDVYCHDIKLDTSIKDVLGTDICYICVPTPSKKDGSCDTSVVSKVIHDLDTNKYEGIVAIKSTVTPGTTEVFQLNYPNMTICFVPEFLRERCAETDFTENHDLCIIGTKSYAVFNSIKESHGKYPKEIRKLSPTEAELAKYFNNTFNATLITFANSFYEICKLMNSDYRAIKDSLTLVEHIPDKYLDCNSTFRGFGGMCLPKDTRALDALCKTAELDVKFFEMLLSENEKYKTTVFRGMRKE
jgi:UDPglucose 6-dehydrogenase